MEVSARRILLLLLLAAAVSGWFSVWAQESETSSVRVIVTADGQAVAGATVTVDGAMMQTNENGVAFFSGVSTGSKRLQVSADGFATSVQIINVGLLTNISRVTLQRNQQIMGVVLVESGDIGASVYVDGTRVGKIGSTGKLITHAITGRRRVVLRKDGFKDVGSFVNVDEDLTTTVSLPDMTQISPLDSDTNALPPGNNPDNETPESGTDTITKAKASDNTSGWLIPAMFGLMFLMIAFTGGLAFYLYKKRKEETAQPRPTTPVFRQDGSFDVYHRESVIGRGGMATLFLAKDPSGMELALKVMDIALTKDPDLVTKFLREGEYISRIREHRPDAAVTEIYKFGRENGEKDTLPFIAMELLRGKDLYHALKQHPGGLPVDQVVPVVSSVAYTLAAAHELKITHRDVTPDNIIMEKRGSNKFRYVLIDFGIARHEFTQHKTLDGSIAGKPPYMSPEQCSNDDVDHRTDIYSLGIVMYALLTGKPPFYGSNPIAVMRDHTDTPVPPLPASVPEPLQKLISSMLEKDRNNRISDMDQVSRELTTL